MNFIMGGSDGVENPLGLPTPDTALRPFEIIHRGNP
jgi:hypothetical protein